MNSNEIRQKFLDFFESKGHKIVPSAPIVVKNDPTLMFTNAGMNQFKDYFLGNKKAEAKRIADTQKCLRVSGKHNDLEDVGHDTYHHTMFEMLGNWSFGDYFKKEAIDWAWELLTEVYKLDKSRLYVTYFEGSEEDGISADEEAKNQWKNYVSENHIIPGNKKDNFWEMGDSGPCGPSSEIHVDLRSEADRKQQSGAELVNNDHPHVIEIWNLVFIEFNRKADSTLEKLPAQHVDTGMGLERIVRAVLAQERGFDGTTNNYDTDLFQVSIKELERLSGKTYGNNEETDVAIRVIADHIRAIVFVIGDGQLPANNGAGYVVRRILRRAVRYGYSFLDLKEPFLNQLVAGLANNFKSIFPEVLEQKDFITQVILKEEEAFLRTLERGLQLIDRTEIEQFKNQFSKKTLSSENIDLLTIESIDDGYFIVIPKDKEREPSINVILKRGVNLSNDDFEKKYKTKLTQFLAFNKSEAFIFEIFKLGEHNLSDLTHLSIKIELSGEQVFELYDTYGFPLDLTMLIAKERGFTVDIDGFNQHMAEQKNRSKADAAKETDDWIVVKEEEGNAFVGYDVMEAPTHIVRYRKIVAKKKELFQLVLNQTPFYGESGGQVGDTGVLEGINESVNIIDTQKENDLIVHITDKLPENIEAEFTAKVDAAKRKLTENNHSATHLLHAALKQVLGEHVNQKGSLVNADYLRFDFSHFEKVTDEQLEKIENIVNSRIRENIVLDEKRSVPIAQAKEMGAMALFGEKYGDTVRVITFNPEFSIELCGGTHVKSTGQIGYFKITTGTSVAAGVRRIEAVTAAKADEYIKEQLQVVDTVKELLNHPQDVTKALKGLVEEVDDLKKRLESLENEKVQEVKRMLLARADKSNGVTKIIEKVEVPNADALKTLAYGLKNETENLFAVLAADINGKPLLAVMIADNLVNEKSLHAGNIIRELAKEIKGGGGGQPFFATAGGNDVSGINKVLEKAKSII